MTSALLAAFDQQAAWCDSPAPFTARMLRRSRHWLAADAAAHAFFAALTADPLAGAVPLRWVGGLHLLALRGLQPWSALWPPAKPARAAADAALDAAITQAWQTQQPLLRDALSRPPQTNEVQRSAALLPGLLFVAQQTRLPLALLEIGASAGLNLWCDRWHLAPAAELASASASALDDRSAWTWGDPEAPLCLRPAWTGPPPPLAAPLHVAYRAGCDADPIDLTQPGQAERLASFIWPDQAERLLRLRKASDAARRFMAAAGLRVQAQPAANFVQTELRAPRAGLATVLMHSVVWQYIGAEEQRAITEAVHAAAARATTATPLAWLRFEPARLMGDVELRCQVWPAGADHLLARCHPHGAHIDWLHGA